MKIFLGIAAAVGLALASAGDAQAQFARHERVTVTPLKEKGKAVGVRIKMTLRPEEYKKVRVGINEAGKRYAGKSGDWRKGASDVGDGHLLYQFPEIKLAPKTPKEVTLDLRYKDAPNLKPGAQIEIVSAFNGWASYADHWHVFGMTSSLVGSPEKYTLPKADPAAAKDSKGKESAARTTPKKPKAKKPTAQTIKNSASAASAQTRSTRTRRTAATPKKPARAATSARTRSR